MNVPATESGRIALVTDSEHPELADDDRLLIPALSAHGLTGVAARWDDRGVAWASFGAVVLRSPWDYYLRAAEFHAWLVRVEREARAVLNPPEVIRWNADKRYLRALAERDVSTVETLFIEPSGVMPSLSQRVAERGWREAVLKPAVSAGSHQTIRFRTQEASRHQALLESILRRGVTALVQPYLAEVETEGEWSFVFFDRAFSHAVLKRPSAGDFRVQPAFGGTVESREAPSQLRRAAEAALAAVSGPLLYARVDGFLLKGRFSVAEVELIEPALYLAQHPLAAARFAAALSRALARGTSAAPGAER